MGSRLRFTRHQVAEALRKAGSIKLAAEELGCSRQTIDGYLFRFPELKKLLIQAGGPERTKAPRPQRARRPADHAAGDTLRSNDGKGPLVATILKIERGTAVLEVTRPGGKRRDRVRLPATFLSSPNCGWVRVERN